jgi:AbrB family looped-hinge helix DNA binding protein
MSESTITSKGQVTIPADIRKALDLSPGQIVVFTKVQDGTAIVRVKRRSILELKGLLKGARARRKVPINEMNIGRS